MNPKYLRINLGIALTFVFFTCEKNPQVLPQYSPVSLTVLYTNDEHGWIEGSDNSNGAARLFGLWTEDEGYTATGSYLILSGGDNWTGPAISTWFQGESTVEVMNAMGYAASAIGNHEFDFGTGADILAQRIAEADFPYLAANIENKTTGEPPDFIQAYTLVNVSDITVGIIGLSSLSTPYSTFPTHVADYQFTDYVEALNATVPVVREAGAQLVLVVSHICRYEMNPLIAAAANLGVVMIGGGHCHELNAEVQGNVAIVSAGSWMTNYAKVSITFDRNSETILNVTAETLPNTGGSPESSIAGIVSTWQQAVNTELGEVIGYAEAEIGYQTNAIRNLVADSWLYVYPPADFAITNTGGIRQPIPAGDITRETIVGVLPFNNNLYELEMTGSQVEAFMDNFGNAMAIAGFTALDGLKWKNGTLVDLSATYQVLTSDYLYVRDDLPFSQYDPSPNITGINYAQPTIDYIESLNTSSTDPLNNYLDNQPRR